MRINLYFSLTTLTTFGYGDIHPTMPVAGVWSTLEDAMFSMASSSIDNFRGASMGPVPHRGVGVFSTIQYTSSCYTSSCFTEFMNSVKSTGLRRFRTADFGRIWTSNPRG